MEARFWGLGCIREYFAHLCEIREGRRRLTESRRESFELVQLTKNGSSWVFSPETKVTLPTAHGSEIVRSFCFVDQVSFPFPLGDFLSGLTWHQAPDRGYGWRRWRGASMARRRTVTKSPIRESIENETGLQSKLLAASFALGLHSAGVPNVPEAPLTVSPDPQKVHRTIEHSVHTATAQVWLVIKSITKYNT